MHRRFHAPAIALTACSLALGACTQMTRHSNTMLFGTQTKLGVDLGVDATNLPNLSIGYRRQEAVVMPLVANVQGTSKGGDLEPCEMTPGFDSEGVVPPPPQSATQPTAVARDGTGAPPGVVDTKALHPCLLVARRFGKQGLELEDSYSVLASFGAEFEGGNKGQDIDAQAGLAQYFATGAAAQLLAVTGGAAVISTGSAAKAAVSNAENAAAAATVLAPEQAQRIALGTALYAKAADAGGNDARRDALVSETALACFESAERKQAVLTEMRAEPLLAAYADDIVAADSISRFARLYDRVGTGGGDALRRIILDKCY